MGELERSRSSEWNPKLRKAAPRVLVRSARLAAVLLLAVWVGPVSFVQTDAWSLLSWAGAPGRAAATTSDDERHVIPAGGALTLQPGTRLDLRLKDGTVVHGRYLGRTLVDSAVYAPRFEAYARSSADARFALGETLRVRLRDGREWTSTFAGYAEQTLLLVNPDSAGRLRVPFEFARTVRRANGEEVDPQELARAFRGHTIPSAEALVMGEWAPSGKPGEEWSGALHVPVDDIETATVSLPAASGGGNHGVSGGQVAGIILVSVVIGTIITLVLVGYALNQIFSGDGCTVNSSAKSILSSALVRRTTRAYDRDRACYVGDPLAMPAALPTNAVALQLAPPAAPEH